MATIKKAKDGQLVPSEMKPGTMIKKADRDARATKMADALDKQAGKGKYAPKAAAAKPKAKAKDGKWIQKAINPKHKGYCTPMTKATCTPKRKALAMTLKKMAKAKKGK